MNKSKKTDDDDYPPPPFGVQGPHAFIKLTKGRWAIVDPEDFDCLSLYNWSYSQDAKYPDWGCAKTSVRTTEGKQKHIAMHRFLMNTQVGMVVDHINGDPLDNRKSNLRNSTQETNMRNRGENKNNTSGQKGLILNKRSNRWQVTVSPSYEFDSKETAILVAKAFLKIAHMGLNRKTNTFTEDDLVQLAQAA